MKDYSESSDEELLREYHTDRNPLLLNILFKRHANVGFRTAMRYMRSQPDAEDVLQLAFIHFLQNLQHTREGSTNVKAWLMKIIVNISIDKLREEKRRAARQQKVASERFNQFQQKENLVENNNDREELKNKIKSCVDTLPEKYRSPIWLVLYEGFSYPEVASVLALPEKTVRTQVSRGLERLREILGSFGTVLSISLITDLISESKLEIAPDSVSKIIESPELYQKINTHSTRVIAQSTQSIFTIMTKYILIGAVVLSSTFGIYYWQNNNEIISNAPTKIPAKLHEPLRLNLDFNNPQQKMPYFYAGNYKITEKGGLNQSGALEINDFFSMKIPLKKEQLPLKITYRYNVKFNDFDERSSFETVWGNWDKVGIFYLSPMVTSRGKKLNEYVYDKDSDWIETTIWASENSIDYWINGKRLSVYIFSSKELNQNLYFKFYYKIKMDNLSIQTVSKSECPDIAEFKLANDEIIKNANTTMGSNKTSLQKYFPKYFTSNYEPFHLTHPACSENENAEYFKNSSESRKEK